MAWHGPIKAVSVRLPEDLHREIKSVAPKRGLTVEACYEEALTSWLAQSNSKITPIRDEGLDADLRKILAFFEEATSQHASAGDSTIARLVLDRLGLNKGLKQKKSR